MSTIPLDYRGVVDPVLRNTFGGGNPVLLSRDGFVLETVTTE